MVLKLVSMLIPTLSLRAAGLARDTFSNRRKRTACYLTFLGIVISIRRRLIFSLIEILTFFLQVTTEATDSYALDT